MTRASEDWRDELMRRVARAAAGRVPAGVGVHVAVVAEPYLGRILDGSKRVESRFGRSRRAPFGRVGPGDVVLLKRVSGPVVGVARVEEAWWEALTPEGLRAVRERFGGEMGVEPEFWSSVAGARYVTLVRLAAVHEVAPIACGKRDRSGWVVVREGAAGRGA